MLNSAFNDGPLDLAGVRYVRGVGMHAPCKARFRLPPGSWRLRATAGVGDSARSCELALVRLAVLGDSDRQLAESGPLRLGTAPWAVDVDLSGQSTVTLDAGDAGNGRDCDHVVWADAMLVPRGAPDLTDRRPTSVGTPAPPQRGHSRGRYGPPGPGA